IKKRTTVIIAPTTTELITTVALTIATTAVPATTIVQTNQPILIKLVDQIKPMVIQTTRNTLEKILIQTLYIQTQSQRKVPVQQQQLLKPPQQYNHLLIAN